MNLKPNGCFLRTLVRNSSKFINLVILYYVVIQLIGTIFVNAANEPHEEEFTINSIVSMPNEIEYCHALTTYSHYLFQNNDAKEKESSSDNASNASKVTDVGFLHAFIASFSVIIVSEICDKTFFIAAIMSMRHPRLTVFLGAISALALMTVLSGEFNSIQIWFQLILLYVQLCNLEIVFSKTYKTFWCSFAAVFGIAAQIIPKIYTHYISTALFALFGLKMLKEGYYMSATEGQEELEEVQSDLKKREDEVSELLNIFIKYCVRVCLFYLSLWSLFNYLCSPISLFNYYL